MVKDSLDSLPGKDDDRGSVADQAHAADEHQEEALRHPAEQVLVAGEHGKSLQNI